MVIPREQRYSTKNGSGLDSLGHFLAFLLLFASSRCCFRRVDFVTAPVYSSILLRLCFLGSCSLTVEAINTSSLRVEVDLTSVERVAV